MLLSALLLAAAAQAAPALPMTGDQVGPGPATFYRSSLGAAQAARAVRAGQGCRSPGVDLVAQPATATMRTLGDLPAANHTLTVLRSVDGCPVSSTVRYDVERPARR